MMNHPNIPATLTSGEALVNQTVESYGGIEKVLSLFGSTFEEATIAAVSKKPTATTRKRKTKAGFSISVGADCRIWELAVLMAQGQLDVNTDDRVAVLVADALDRAGHRDASNEIMVWNKLANASVMRDPKKDLDAKPTKKATKKDRPPSIETPDLAVHQKAVEKIQREIGDANAKGDHKKLQARRSKRAEIFSKAIAAGVPANRIAGWSGLSGTFVRKTAARVAG